MAHEVTVLSILLISTKDLSFPYWNWETSTEKHKTTAHEMIAVTMIAVMQRATSTLISRIITPSFEVGIVT